MNIEKLKEWFNSEQDKKGNKIRHDCRYCMISEMYDD